MNTREIIENELTNPEVIHVASVEARRMNVSVDEAIVFLIKKALMPPHEGRQ